MNALHLASKEGHVEVVSELLQREANVDAATKVSITHLMHVISLSKFSEDSALDKNQGMLLMKYFSTLFSLENLKQKDSIFCKLSKHREQDKSVDVSCFSSFRKETQHCI